MKHDPNEITRVSLWALLGAFLSFWNAQCGGGAHGGERYRICVAAMRDLEAGAVLTAHDTAIRLRPIDADSTDYFDDQSTITGRQLARYVLRGDVIRRGSLVRDRLLCPVLFTVKIEPTPLVLKQGARVALIPPSSTVASRIFIVEAEPVANVLTLRASHAEDALPFVRVPQAFRVLVVPSR